VLINSAVSSLKQDVLPSRLVAQQGHVWIIRVAINVEKQQFEYGS
jgi:hypothetical protein